MKVKTTKPVMLHKNSNVVVEITPKYIGDYRGLYKLAEQGIWFICEENGYVTLRNVSNVTFFAPKGLEVAKVLPFKEANIESVAYDGYDRKGGFGSTGVK